jgi:thymidylate synthase (FAD)
MTNKSIELYSDGIGRVELVDFMGTDKKIVNSARVSFGQDNDSELDERDKKLINYLIEHKHTSTLEHNVVTFKFVVPLFIRSQHHRHRTWSYNEISRRYTAEKLEFYEPKHFRTQHKSNRQASNESELINPMIPTDDCDINGNRLRQGIPVDADQVIKRHHALSVNLYNDLMEAGVCREQARGVLPQNLYTEYYGTVNLGNLLKFIELRTHAGAQWEIQKVAEACLEIISELWPITVNSYQKIKNK